MYIYVSTSNLIHMFLIITQIMCEKVQYSSLTISSIMSHLHFILEIIIVYLNFFIPSNSHILWQGL
jgi:hypothetical protein